MAKSSKKRAGEKLAIVTPPVPADMAQLREKLTNMVGANAEEILNATIEQAKSGHYLAMRCLFEMVGLYPVTVEKKDEEGESMAEVLMERLGLAGDEKT